MANTSCPNARQTDIPSNLKKRRTNGVRVESPGASSKWRVGPGSSNCTRSGLAFINELRNVIPSVALSVYNSVSPAVTLLKDLTIEATELHRAKSTKAKQKGGSLRPLHAPNYSAV